VKIGSGIERLRMGVLNGPILNSQSNLQSPNPIFNPQIIKSSVCGAAVAP
jgi:hypothetical protein